MYTQCPECQTLFRIGPEQLKAAGGNVRCCRCDSVFNALNYLQEGKAEELSLGTPDNLATLAPTQYDDQTSPSSDEMITDYLAELQLSKTDEPDNSTPDQTESESSVESSAQEGLTSTETSTSLFSDYLAELNISEELGDDIDSATLPIQEEAIPEYELDELTEPPLDSAKEDDENQEEDVDHLVSLFFYDPSEHQQTDEVNPESANIDDVEIDIEETLSAPLEIPEENQQELPWQQDESSATISAGDENLYQEKEVTDVEETPPSPLEMPEEKEPEFSLEQDAFVITSTTIENEHSQQEEVESEAEMGSDEDDVQPITEEPLFYEEEPLPTKEQEPQSDETSEVEHSPYNLSQPLPEIEPAESAEPSLEESLAQPIEKKPSSWIWVVLILLLLIIGVAQLAWFEREHLNRYPGGHELLVKACAFAGCKVQPQRDPDAFKVLERAITSHPSKPNALLLQLTFSNQAPFSQAYPKLQLSLYDSNENLVARRVFLPSEYLDNEADSTALIRSGEKISIDMSLQDPGSNVTGFKFDFN